MIALQKEILNDIDEIWTQISADFSFKRTNFDFGNIFVKTQASHCGEIGHA